MRKLILVLASCFALVACGPQPQPAVYPAAPAASDAATSMVYPNPNGVPTAQPSGGVDTSSALLGAAGGAAVGYMLGKSSNSAAHAPRVINQTTVVKQTIVKQAPQPRSITPRYTPRPSSYSSYRSSSFRARR